MFPAIECELDTFNLAISVDDLGNAFVVAQSFGAQNIILFLGCAFSCIFYLSKYILREIAQ